MAIVTSETKIYNISDESETGGVIAAIVEKATSQNQTVMRFQANGGNYHTEIKWGVVDNDKVEEVAGYKDFDKVGAKWQPIGGNEGATKRSRAYKGLSLLLEEIS